jgi:hypothetical protein
VQFTKVDSLAVVNTLRGNKYVSFKVQLVDAVSKDVLGEFDQVRFDKDNLFQYKSVQYKVNTAGIGSRDVQLIMIAGDNGNNSYMAADRFSTSNVIAKRNPVEISYQGELAVENYSLAQNYPNPFNPATIINYAIPSVATLHATSVQHVTLKVYDILGREITTLVNEYQSAGRYSVSFDGSNLASGIYIYRLQVNDYVMSKKMMLVK